MIASQELSLRTNKTPENESVTPRILNPPIKERTEDVKRD